MLWHKHNNNGRDAIHSMADVERNLLLINPDVYKFVSCASIDLIPFFMLTLDFDVISTHFIFNLAYSVAVKSKQWQLKKKKT